MSSALERLIAPYAAAVQGQPMDALDPVWEALAQEGGRTPSAGRGDGDGGAGRRGGGGGGDFWDRFGGDIEIFYGGNKFNPSSVDASHGGHLHWAAQRGPLVKALKRIERMGFDVWQHPKFGGVGKHSPGSWHYEGRAGDINYYGGGRWDSEAQALDWLERFLARRI